MPRKTCRTCGDMGHQARTCQKTYPGIDALLGKVPDEQVAAAYGLTASAVARMRRRAGILSAAFGVRPVDLGLDRLRDAQAAPEGQHFRITTSRGLMAMALNAASRDSNRQADLRHLVSEIDPAGVHVCAMQVPHNDAEWRTLWLAKMRHDPEPVQLWLDVSFESLETCSVQA